MLITVLVLLELLLRGAYGVRNTVVSEVALPYVLDDEYGPAPPWLDGLRILQSDQTLLWKNRANLHRKYVDVFGPVNRSEERIAILRRFSPKLPESLKGNPAWEISLNADGFRDADFSPKPASAFRIVCLGDSWTFGANVGQDQTYPRQLETVLDAQFPQADVQVLNLGVLGYSSFQGLELLKRTALNLQPDLLILGFAMNDASVDGYRDKDLSHPESPRKAAEVVPALLQQLELLRLLRYWKAVRTYEPVSFGAEIGRSAKEAAEGGNAAVDYNSLEEWTRVSPKDYEENIREMIRLGRNRGAEVVLLFNELWSGSPYKKILESVSKATGAPVVDTEALLRAARSRLENQVESNLNLRPMASPGSSPEPDRKRERVFRVFMGDRPVPKAVFIAGSLPELGGLVPNKIAMYDDGTHGDQRAGDRVWSYAVRLPQNEKVRYVYTNSGREGQWEGLDVPAVRGFQVDSNPGPAYRPVETFGQIYLQADNWHTNAAGYRLLASTLLEAISKTPAGQKFRQ